jgi:hypothetical protein
VEKGSLVCKQRRKSKYSVHKNKNFSHVQESASYLQGYLNMLNGVNYQKKRSAIFTQKRNDQKPIFINLSKDSEGPSPQKKQNRHSIKKNPSVIPLRTSMNESMAKIINYEHFRKSQPQWNIPVNTCSAKVIHRGNGDSKRKFYTHVFHDSK